MAANNKKGGRLHIVPGIILYIAFHFLVLVVTGSLFSQQDEDLDKLFDEQSAVQPETGETTSSSSQSMLSVQTPGGKNISLDIMAAADLVGEWDKERDTGIVQEGRDPFTFVQRKIDEKSAPRSSETSNRVFPRSVEIGFFSAVDQLAYGNVTLAAHDEGGETMYDVHEASLYFPVTFIPRTSLKIGKFFLDAGRLNTIHQHDWKFIRTPLVHEHMFADEGVSDTGAQLNFLMPWNFWQELTVGVFNGIVFGHSHTGSEKKQNPLIVVHLKQHFSITQNTGLLFGFSYLRWNPDTDRNRISNQSGFDLTVKRDKRGRGSFEWTNELWYREITDNKNRPFDSPPAPTETSVGFYSFFDYAILDHWNTGIRFDYYEEPSMTADVGYNETPGLTLTDITSVTKSLPLSSDITDSIHLTDGWIDSYTVKNGTYEGTFVLTYKPSEFARYRTSLTYRYEKLYHDTDTLLSMQATFILGAHPAHNY